MELILIAVAAVLLVPIYGYFIDEFVHSVAVRLEIAALSKAAETEGSYSAEMPSGQTVRLPAEFIKRVSRQAASDIHIAVLGFGLFGVYWADGSPLDRMFTDLSQRYNLSVSEIVAATLQATATWTDAEIPPAFLDALRHRHCRQVDGFQDATSAGIRVFAFNEAWLSSVGASTKCCAKPHLSRKVHHWHATSAVAARWITLMHGAKIAIQ